MTTSTTPDFSGAPAESESIAPASPSIAAAFLLVPELRELSPCHHAALGLRRAIALLATHALVDEDTNNSHRAARRLLGWLEDLPDDTPTTWVRIR